MALSWALQIVTVYVCDRLLILLKFSTPDFSTSLNEKAVDDYSFKVWDKE